MKHLFLLASALIFAACSSTSNGGTNTASGFKSPSVTGLASPDAPKAAVGIVDQTHEIVDEKSRTRLGYVDRVRYDSNRVIYWVFGPRHRMRHGYVLPNNAAYRFDDRRTEGRRVAIPLGADVMSFNVRRILQYGSAVALVPLTQEELTEQLLPGRYNDATPAPTAAPSGDGEDDADADSE